MERRKFVGMSLAFMGGISLPRTPLANTNSNSIRFGIVTDIHYADKEHGIHRYYRQSIDKLSQCIKEMNKEKVDFLVELGDFKDLGVDSEETLKFLETIEREFQKFNGSCYHVLGNHDTDNILKKQFLKRISNAGFSQAKNYYSFTKKGFQFIVLDANFSSKGVSYNKGNIDWRDCHVTQEQLDWMENKLKDNRLPSIVFIHQRLDSFHSLKDFCPDNSDEIRSILENSGNVLAVIQGHDHRGGFNKINNIPYYTLRGLIRGSGLENNSFAIVEIEKNFKNNHVIKINGYGKAVSMNLG